jgi:DUF1009 family protein
VSRAGPEVLGLIAGGGAFPRELARAARAAGRRVAAVAFRGHTDPRIGDDAEVVGWLHPGQLEAVAESLRSAGVRDAVMAGKLPKAPLLEPAGADLLDPAGQRLIAGLPDLRDDSILAAVAGYLESRGIHLLSQTRLVPELLPGEGPLGGTRPTAAQLADVAFGWPIAKAVAGLDIGQTVVVKDRAVLAVEAIEGTDAAVRRGGAIGAGAVVVKVAKPRQDPRFDAPTVGPDTLAALIDAGAAALAFEAHRTVVLDRRRLAARADAHGVALVGVDPQRLPQGAA